MSADRIGTFFGHANSWRENDGVEPWALEKAHCCGYWVSHCQSLSCLLSLCTTEYCRPEDLGRLPKGNLPFFAPAAGLRSLTWVHFEARAGRFHGDSDGGAIHRSLERPGHVSAPLVHGLRLIVWQQLGLPFPQNTPPGATELSSWPTDLRRPPIECRIAVPGSVRS
jgi:hypothetical protein